MHRGGQNAKASEVVVVGNAGVDTNVFLDRDALDPAVEAHFTRNVRYVAHAGGFAARGYARLGYPTAFLGALGDDPDGALVREAFAREGSTRPVSSRIRPARRAASTSFSGTAGGATSTTARAT